jgi:predicted ABC-type ATPase
MVRRYYSGIANMRDLYRPLAGEAEIFDNSDSRRLLIAEKRAGLELKIRDPERWALSEGMTA